MGPPLTSCITATRGMPCKSSLMLHVAPAGRARERDDLIVLPEAELGDEEPVRCQARRPRSRRGA